MVLPGSATEQGLSGISRRWTLTRPLLGGRLRRRRGEARHGRRAPAVTRVQLAPGALARIAQWEPVPVEALYLPEVHLVGAILHGLREQERFWPRILRLEFLVAFQKDILLLSLLLMLMVLLFLLLVLLGLALALRLGSATVILVGASGIGVMAYLCDLRGDLWVRVAPGAGKAEP